MWSRLRGMRSWDQRRWWAVLAGLALLGGLIGLLATRQRLPRADIGLTYGVGYDHVQYEAGEGCVCCHSQERHEAQPEYEHPPSPLQAIPPGASPEAEGEGEEEGEGPAGRANYFFEQRAYPRDTLPHAALVKAIKQTADMSASNFSAASTANTWELVGPAPMRNSYMGAVQIDVSGRVTALAVDPSDASGDTVYLAAAQGGVWKTTNGGDSWTPLTDDQASLSMGALALAPSDPNVIYAGTGEPNSGLDNYYGAGVLKSTDGGASWTRHGASEFTGAGISSIVVHPQDPNTVYAASSIRVGQAGPQTPETGIFRSTDGGASWAKLLGCQGCSASDLVMSPNDPRTLYAAFDGQGIFKTTDGGVSNWTQLTNGLITSNFGRIELAIGAKGGQDYVYAGFHVMIQGQYDGPGLFYSKDGGTSWAQFATPYPNYCTQQCWYDNVIGVDPNDADVIYVGGSAAYNFQSSPPTVRQVFVKNVSGGSTATWYDLSPQTGGAANKSLHPDAHAVAFGPDGSVWVGTDGGVSRSTDGGATWQHKNSNLATLQFTGIAVHPTDSSVVYGGMQDNNKAIYSGSGTAWDARDAGDGGFALIDPHDPTIFYGSRYSVSFQRNEQSGANPNAPNWGADWPVKTNGIDPQDRALFYAPFALDSSTAGVLYYGTHRLYRTADRGDSWSAISGDLTGGGSRAAISAIAVAPSASGTVYVGSSDSKLHVTADAGTGNNFTDVTQAPLPGRYVTDFAVDPSDDQLAYVTFSGFDTHTPGSPGHVFKTSDRGGSWTDVSGNLPDIPVSTIVLDGGDIYVGTDVGVYVSSDGGTKWSPFGSGLPKAAVVDMVLFDHGGEKTLFAGTHGRSVWKIELGGAPPALKDKHIFLPLVLRNYASSSVPAPTPTFTATPVQQFNTPTPTSTPTQVPTPVPTSESTPEPTATPDPSIPGYPDPFDDAGNGWFEGTVGNCSAALGGGEYSVTASSGDICWDTAEAGTTQITGTFEVEARGDGNGAYGLVLGSNASENRLYAFLVAPAYQQYAFWYYDGSAWSYFTDPDGDGWVDVSGAGWINGGTGVNVLKVRRGNIADQSTFTLYANGNYLSAYVDADATPGEYFGVVNYDFSYASSTAAFDDYAVAQETVVYEHDFSDPDNGWPTGSTADNSCSFTYMAEEYRIDAAADYACLALKGQAKNGTYEVSARRSTMEGSYSYSALYGLMFGVSDDFSQFYTLWVEPDGQQVAAYKYMSSTWYYMGDGWATISGTNVISPGLGVNRIRAEQDGPFIAAQINGVYVDLTPVTSPGSESYVYDPTYNTNPPTGDYFGLISMAFPSSSVTTYHDDYRVIGWQTLEMSALPGPSKERLALEIEVPSEVLPPGRVNGE